MKTDHGLKMQVLKLSFLLLAFLSYYADAKTLRVDEVTASVTNGDFTVTPNGTGDIILGSGSGFVKLTSGVLSNQALIDVTSDITGITPIANGGTGSATQNFVDLTTNQSISGEKTFTGKFEASSTSNGFKPCPPMTEAQRDAIASPEEGDCVINSDENTVNFYLGSAWGQIGGGNKNVAPYSSTTTLSTDVDFIYCDTFSGNVTLNLPSCLSNQGKVYRIEKTHSSNQCIIDPNGSEFIESMSTLTLYSDDDYVEITCGILGVWDLSQDGILVAVKYRSDSGQSISNGSTDILKYEDIVYDTHSAYNITTGQFTAPMSGYYYASAQLSYASASWILGGRQQIFLYKNGSQEILLSSMYQQRATSSYTPAGIGGSSIVYLEKGDTCDIRTDHVESSARSISNISTRNTLTIHRIKQ